MDEIFYKVYSGKALACMCGCAGKWSMADTAPGAIKAIVSKMKKLNPELDQAAGCYHVTVGKRMYAAYFA